MSFKIVLVLAFATIASAGIIAEHAHYQHEQPANYDFNYEVHDTHTGDIKRQYEVAKDGNIQGEYSLVEPDGIHRRVVSYTANDHEGFNAKVHREAWNGHGPAPAHITKVIQPATITKVIQPAVHAYSAPVHSYPSHTSYVAPSHTSYVAPSHTSYVAPSHTTYSVPSHQSSHQYQSSHNSNYYHH